MIENLKRDQQQNTLEDADVFAPFRQQDEEDEVTPRVKVGGASSYGNCLAVLRCTCSICNQLTGTKIPSFFLVHPTGDVLSCVTISKIQFPRCNESHVNSKSASVDLDNRILQISICGKSAAATTTHRDICFVVRTSTHCCILLARPKGPKSNNNTLECSNTYELTEKARIDLQSSLDTNQPSHLPFHVTCDPKTSISLFTTPSFAILCTNETGTRTNIHQVTYREKPCIKSYEFSPQLSDISIIEYDTRHRHILWAAARPVTMPAISERFFKRGGSGAIVEGLTGYGHSLYRIDLRNESVNFAWSPSHDEYMVDGVYSISGIMPDTVRDYILWIGSSSVGRMWALDVRYKSPKVLVRWSLPLLCDDLGAHCSISGVYGAGVLMNQVLSLPPTSKEHLPTMFSIKKDNNVSTLHAYQFPSSMPRFQTAPLESAGFIAVPKSQYETTSIARSTTFALPDISERTFNIGLALLRLPSATILGGKKLCRLGYKSIPAYSVYAFTMTSIGDVYCHTLLECDAKEEPKARHFPGLPVGAMCIPVPEGRNRNKRKREESSNHHLVIELSNTFPVPSSAISTFVNGHDNDLGCQTYDLLIKDSNECCKMEPKRDMPCTKNPAADQYPCSFHDLQGDQRLNEGDFDTLILSDNKDLQSDVHTSINQEDLEQNVEISHSASGFGLSTASDHVSTGQGMHVDSNRVKLQNQYLLVAVPKVQEGHTQHHEVNAGDMKHDILEKLSASYFESGDVKEEDTNQFEVQEENNSSDNDSEEEENL